jgi:hypothetical protein
MLPRKPALPRYASFSTSYDLFVGRQSFADNAAKATVCDWKVATKTTLPNGPISPL